jgi:hypothetical protein
MGREREGILSSFGKTVSEGNQGNWGFLGAKAQHYNLEIFNFETQGIN